MPQRQFETTVPSPPTQALDEPIESIGNSIDVSPDYLGRTSHDELADYLAANGHWYQKSGAGDEDPELAYLSPVILGIKIGCEAANARLDKGVSDPMERVRIADEVLGYAKLVNQTDASRASFLGGFTFSEYDNELVYDMVKPVLEKIAIPSSAMATLAAATALQSLDMLQHARDLQLHDPLEDYEDTFITPFVEAQGVKQASATILAPGVIGFRDKEGLVRAYGLADTAKLLADTGCTFDQYLDMPFKTRMDHLFAPADIYEVMYQSNHEVRIDPRPVEELLPDVPASHVEAFQFMHRYDMRESMYHKFGIDVADLDIKAQAYLLKYCLESSVDTFDRLSIASRGVEQKSRTAFLEAFLSTEFGDDFGSTLVSIAEYATPAEAQEVFELTSQYRELSKKYASMFAPYDPEFAKASERAMNERLTDILVGVEKVAREGSLTEDVAPHRDSPNYLHDGRFDITVSSVSEALEIMHGLGQTLETITDVVPDPDTHVSRVVNNEAEVGYQIYRFSHPTKGEVLLHIRLYGSGAYDKAFEYGNYDGVEATISFVASPRKKYRLQSDKDPEGVSIRFDREGRLQFERPDSELRSPVRAEGTVSMDISSGMGDSRSLPVRIGRFIAAGNRQRAQKMQTDVSLHHNTNYFNQQKYGPAEGFAGLGKYVRTMAESRITTQKSHSVGRRTLQTISK